MKYKRVVRILFVCLGNICRSPMAEAVFMQMVREAGLSQHFEVESAGIGNWHAGQPPHPGTVNVLRKNSIEVNGKTARQINPTDLKAFDYIVAMDSENVSDIQSRFGKRVPRLMDFAPQSLVRDVPDPFYEGNFEAVYQLIQVGCKGLLDYIRQIERF